MKIKLIENIYVQKLKNQSATHKITADFVFRFTTFSVIPYSIMQHRNHYYYLSLVENDDFRTDLVIGPTSKANKKRVTLFITFTNVFFYFGDKKRVFLTF